LHRLVTVVAAVVAGAASAAESQEQPYRVAARKRIVAVINDGSGSVAVVVAVKYNADGAFGADAPGTPPLVKWREECESREQCEQFECDRRRCA
jgi:hypothetical protein